MNLGQRLRQTRLEAGLSQRQLCGDVITRNMLSQIENGSARPSMDTLSYLAGRLGKPMSYFLEDGAVVSPNAEMMAQGRNAYTQRDFAQVITILNNYQKPDAIFDEEYGLLRLLSLLEMAEQAISKRKLSQARQLLSVAEEEKTCYCTEEMTRRRLLLQAMASQQPVKLPAEDRYLLVRAGIFLQERDFRRCIALLEACDDQTGGQWHFLRAEAAMGMKNYAVAVKHYRRAERDYPRESYPKLEQCYRAMEDYKMAYEYACKQR